MHFVWIMCGFWWQIGVYSAASGTRQNLLSCRWFAAPLFKHMIVVFFFGDFLMYLGAFIISEWNTVRCLFQTSFSGKTNDEDVRCRIMLNSCQCWKAHACVKHCAWNMSLAKLFNGWHDRRSNDKQRLKKHIETMVGAYVWSSCDQKAKLFSHRLITH